MSTFNDGVGQHSEEEITIDLKEVFFALLEKAWLIILVGAILGGIAYFYTTTFVDPIYESTTKVYILNRSSDDAVTTSDLQSSSELTSDYQELILSRDVLETVAANLDLDMGYTELINSISVETMSDTRIIAITVSNTSPQLAQSIAVELRTVASEHIQTVMEISAVNIVEQANLPEQPTSPNVVKNILMATLVGFVLTCGIIVLKVILDDKIKTPDDVEKHLGISLLGAIPLTEGEAKASKRSKGNRNARTNEMRAAQARQRKQESNKKVAGAQQATQQDRTARREQ